MKRGTPLKRRTALKADPAKVREFHQRAIANSNPKRRPISLASPEQREFVKGRFCIVCGRDSADMPIDPAHIIDRSLLSEGQDDPRAVVPLCRADHDRFDTGRLDLLPYLEQDGWRDHLAFAVARIGLVSTLQRVTNRRWQEVPS